MTEPDLSILPPTEHRMEGELRVCDPSTIDHTGTIDAMRIERMQQELQEGFDLLRKYRLAASIFGSSRALPDSQDYKDAEALATKLSKSGFAIITGGAAFEAGGQSVGLNIALPTEQASNSYLTEQKTFNYFFTRKVMLTFASEVYVYFPGGFGTLNEFFEILTLIQTKKIKRVPIILYGSAYWTPLLEIIQNHIYGTYSAIDKDDINIYTLVDGVDAAYDQILKSVKC